MAPTMVNVNSAVPFLKLAIIDYKRGR